MINLPSLSKNKFFSASLLFFLLVFLLVPFVTLGAKTVFAYSSGPISTYQRDVFEPAVFGTSEMNLESFTWESFKALLASISIFLNGSTINEEYKDQLSLLPSSAVGTVAALIPMLYATPPVSGVEYLAHLGENLGLATPAYAQGVGFRSLQPVLPVWQAFRNIAYVLFVIIFVLIGLAIMFRVRLNPQTVIGIQNAIPRLVVALLLVTFSYAIAGFAYDLIFVLIYLTLATLDASNLINITGLGAGIVNELISKGNVVHLVLVVLVSSLGNITGVLSDLTIGLLNPFGWIPELAEITSFVFSWTIGPIIGFFLSIILGIVLIIVLMRLVWILLSSYIQIVLAVIFAPFQLMLGALPAVETFGFGAWIRGLISNALVFPATFLLILLAHILMGPTRWGIPKPFEDILARIGIDTSCFGIRVLNLFGLNCDVGYGAPDTQGVLPPLLGSGWFDPSGAQALIGLGILLMLPGILNRLKEAIRGRVPPLEILATPLERQAAGGAMVLVGGPVKRGWDRLTRPVVEALPEKPKIIRQAVTAPGRIVGRVGEEMGRLERKPPG